MIAVWFSKGAASAVAAHLALVKYGRDNVRIVNNPIIEEDSDNDRFMADVQRYLNHPIEVATNSKYPAGSAEEVWRKRRFMSGPRGAPCTTELKKGARYEWQKIHQPSHHVLGFTVDEQARFERFKLTECPNTLAPLIEDGFTKQDCYDFLRDVMNIEPPRIYALGYPNANCIGCPKASSPTYWNKVRETHPQVFEARATLSREIGARLVKVKGDRIYLDQLDPKAKGRPLKSMSIDCGIFCEEPEVSKPSDNRTSKGDEK